MSDPETPYSETEYLIAVLREDEEDGRRMLAGMSDNELTELLKAFRKGRWWIDDTISTRWANRRAEADGYAADGSMAAEESTQQGGS